MSFEIRRMHNGEYSLVARFMYYQEALNRFLAMKAKKLGDVVFERVHKNGSRTVLDRFKHAA